MGVTIHFEGYLRDQGSLKIVLKKARDVGNTFGWQAVDINESSVEMTRIIDEEEISYIGPAEGVQFQPHPDCDLLRLVFGGDMFLQEFVKTQFAGAETHMRVTELLREIEPYFIDLRVDDEGEFWETLDHALLTEHIENTNAALAAYVADNPGVKTKVRLPSGHIVDAME